MAEYASGGGITNHDNAVMVLGYFGQMLLWHSNNMQLHHGNNYQQPMVPILFVWKYIARCYGEVSGVCCHICLHSMLKLGLSDRLAHSYCNVVLPSILHQTILEHAASSGSMEYCQSVTLEGVATRDSAML